MRRFTYLITLVLVGLLVFGSTNAAAQKSMSKGPTIWPYADLKWSELPKSGGGHEGGTLGRSGQGRVRRSV